MLLTHPPLQRAPPALLTGDTVSLQATSVETTSFFPVHGDYYDPLRRRRQRYPDTLWSGDDVSSLSRGAQRRSDPCPRLSLRRQPGAPAPSAIPDEPKKRAVVAHGPSLGRKRPRKQASELSGDRSFAAVHKIVPSPLQCKIKNRQLLRFGPETPPFLCIAGLHEEHITVGIPHAGKPAVTMVQTGTHASLSDIPPPAPFAVRRTAGRRRDRPLRR